MLFNGANSLRSMDNMPVLYSFRRCPYAMRARMAIAYSGIRVELREVVLKDKPAELLIASPKGTVPVLLLNENAGGVILEESLDIMYWALSQYDPDGINLLDVTHYLENELIAENDNVFKTHLDHYKYADRFPEFSELHYRTQGEIFLRKLDKLLSSSQYLTSDDMSVVDLAVFPFIRQFAFVDKAWFDQSCYTYLRRWLDAFLLSELFVSIMPKFPQWHKGDELTVFPSSQQNSQCANSKI